MLLRESQNGWKWMAAAPSTDVFGDGLYPRNYYGDKHRVIGIDLMVERWLPDESLLFSWRFFRILCAQILNANDLEEAILWFTVTSRRNFVNLMILMNSSFSLLIGPTCVLFFYLSSVYASYVIICSIDYLKKKDKQYQIKAAKDEAIRVDDLYKGQYYKSN